MLMQLIKCKFYDDWISMGRSRGRRVRTPTPWKSQAIGFLGNSGTNHPQETIRPRGFNCLLREVLNTLLMTKKTLLCPPTTDGISGSTHDQFYYNLCILWLQDSFLDITEWNWNSVSYWVWWFGSAPPNQVNSSNTTDSFKPNPYAPW